MAGSRDLTKKFAREYPKAGKAKKGEILELLVASTGWTRDHARRAIRQVNVRKGAAREQQRKPRPRKYSYDALVGAAGGMAITAVTFAELLADVRRLPEGRRKSELEAAVTAAVEPYRGGHAVLPFDESCAAAYAEVLFERERAGFPIAIADAQIAAICRAHGTVCATRNTKDFVATEVELIDPWNVAR